MRIAIDYTAAIAQTAGIGRYTRSLVSALARVDRSDDFLLFSAEAPSAERPFEQAPNMEHCVLGLPGRPAGNRAMTILWHRLHAPLPVEALIGRPDVLHAPDFSLPPAPLTPTIVTIHDLAFLTHPEAAVPSLIEYLSSVVPRAVRKADRIIAVSQVTANDVVERLGVPREKVEVIYLGVDPVFQPVRDEAARRALDMRLGLEHPLVLAVGTIEPRKNYARLIEAFAYAAAEDGGPRMLAIGGRKGWLYEGVFEAVERFGVKDRVRFLDYVSDADLPVLYSVADVLAMPSLYEGFGIPVLEAMACGTPVICGNQGSLPEVAGDAAVLVPPTDVDALGSALLEVVRRGDLRATLVERGFARARLFTWDDAARAHVAVYHEIGKASGSRHPGT